MIKLSRNDKCWCGSGKKYKFCHCDFDLALKVFEHNGYPIPKHSLIRSEKEIEGIRESGKINKEIFRILKDKLKIGIKTSEIDKVVYDTTIKYKGIPATLGFNGYKKSCCTSINNVVCHGIPDETIIKAGDIINVDITTNLNGFFADSSEMFLIGNVSEEAKDLVDIAKECLYKGIEIVKPFVSIDEIALKIEPFANSKGFSVVRDLGGHGIGLKFHEEPHIHHFITKEKGMIMAPGMVFTIEPMINEGDFDIEILEDNWTVVTIDDKLSAQWEHTILVTEDGYEILT